jgi:hypothetical protein
MEHRFKPPILVSAAADVGNNELAYPARVVAHVHACLLG